MVAREAIAPPLLVEGGGEDRLPTDQVPLFRGLNGRANMLEGIVPPVPPESFGRIQFDTRVRCTPAIAATSDGPPSFRTMVLGRFHAPYCSDFETIAGAM